MALRDQPYLPLYIKDIMTDEKLNECCASTHGVYIKGIMCLMHKSQEYGKLLLKQKYKQSQDISLNFANMLAKHLPYDVTTIQAAIKELLAENVCKIEGDYLVQQRMVDDNKLSQIRAAAGKKGGESGNFATPNGQANTVNAIVNTSEVVNTDEKYLIPEMLSVFKKHLPKYPGMIDKDFKPLKSIGDFLIIQLNLNGDIVKNQKAILLEWGKLCEVIKEDKFYKIKTLSTISNQIQEIYQISKDGNSKTTGGNSKQGSGKYQSKGTGGY